MMLTIPACEPCPTIARFWAQRLRANLLIDRDPPDVKGITVLAATQVAEKVQSAVILSEAKNLS